MKGYLERKSEKDEKTKLHNGIIASRQHVKYVSKSFNKTTSKIKVT